MSEHQDLFCPFCGERFAGRATCPAHELSLVPYAEVSSLARGIACRDRAGGDDALHDAVADAVEDDDDDEGAGPIHDDARVLSVLEPGFGRAWVALAAVLLASALALGLVRVGDQVVPTHAVAGRLPSLWTWPLIGFCALFLLARRRTPRALRGLRVVVPWLGLVALLTLGLAMARLGGDVFHQPAAYVVTLAGVLLLVGGARLGLPGRPRAQ